MALKYRLVLVAEISLASLFAVVDCRCYSGPGRQAIIMSIVVWAKTEGGVVEGRCHGLFTTSSILVSVADSIRLTKGIYVGVPSPVG